MIAAGPGVPKPLSFLDLCEPLLCVLFLVHVSSYQRIIKEMEACIERAQAEARSASRTRMRVHVSEARSRRCQWAREEKLPALVIRSFKDCALFFRSSSLHPIAPAISPANQLPLEIQHWSSAEYLRSIARQLLFSSRNKNGCSMREILKNILSQGDRPPSRWA